MGIHLSRRRLQQNGTVVGDSGGSSPLDDVEESNGVELVYRSLYAFSGGNEDEVHVRLSVCLSQLMRLMRMEYVCVCVCLPHFEWDQRG